MDGNLGPIPLPWEHIFFGLPCLQQILSCLLLHPTSWDRKEHFGEVSCGLAGKNIGCSCCRAGLRNMFPFGKGSTCDGCLTAWVLTILCKKMLHNVQMHNPTCSCGTCLKSWMEKGWFCQHNPWPKIMMGRLAWRCVCPSNICSWRGWIHPLHKCDLPCSRKELCDDAGTATPESHECHSPRMSPASS